MPTQITALAVSKSYDGRPVLDSVTCTLTAGERTGIVGENGSGKTTLLRLFAGQRRRLALARLLGEPADVLLLDEPTNHLSPALAEEVETALHGYAGALVVVSHDRRLRRRWRGGHLALRAPAAART